MIDEVTGGQDTVGLRVPSHPVAQQLLQAFGGGIAAPSANRFGRVSPTTAQHVREDLGDAVDLILDGGACEVGIESTILDLSSGAPVLLRPGRIGAAEIETVIGAQVARASAQSPRAPGMLEAHYAPQLPLLLAAAADLDRMVREQAARRAGRGAGASRASARLPFCAVADRGARRRRPTPITSTPFCAFSIAPAARLIVVEAPPERPEWDAVRDRLTRAAAASGANPARASAKTRAAGAA